MPETEFFAANADEEGLVQFLIDLGFQFIPDLTYEGPDFLQFRDSNSYRVNRAVTTHFFLLHDQTLLSPIVMFQIGGTGWNAGKYAIRQRQGGPTLSFSCCSSYDENGVSWIPTSSIGYYATYRNADTGRQERIPKLLRSKYHQIVDYIKQHGSPIEQECIGGAVRRYWLLNHARQALIEGSRLAVQGLENLKFA
jgi:hypothetical protein